MNNIEIYIDGVDYSPNVVSPLKMGDLLDEQLDELNITLKYIEKEYFEPLVSVKIVIKNNPEAAASKDMLDEILSRSDYEFTGNTSKDGHLTAKLSGRRITQTYTKYFIVASDNAIEVPVGSGRFIHELYLIERTKFMEGFIGDSLTFTNPNEKNFGSSKPICKIYYSSTINPEEAYFASAYYNIPYKGQVELQGLTDIYNEALNSTNFSEETKDYYTIADTEAKGLREIAYKNRREDGKGEALMQRLTFTGDGYSYSQSIYYLVEFMDGSTTVEEHWLQRKTLINGIEAIETIPLKLTYDDDEIKPTMNIKPPLLSLSDGVYYIKYTIQFVSKDRENAVLYYTIIDLYITSATTYATPKRWTIKDVVNRICDTLEPNRSENRFTFDETQAAKYDKILAPEFTFTNMNLREMLRQVGGFIHAEPRLKDDTESNVIMFDEYGVFNKSHIGSRNYIGYQLKSDINDWCTSIDSSAQNLVNQLDYASGTAYEPTQSFSNSIWGSCGTSLRTETVTARFSQDDNTVIQTYFPIYQIKSLRCVWIPKKGRVDYAITPYVYESADYNGLLKSNNGVYPYAKACAIYYTQGEKNIKGLFYKEDNSISPYLSDFSIANILRSASGDSSLEIEGSDFYFLSFVIEYVPIYSTRIRSIKPTLKTGVTPRTIAYNQGSNLIETKYYGENLKGVVARLGNVEKTYTYNLCYLSDIPKVGYLFDDNYYISAVYTEVLPTYIKCTIGLSKDFNRLSQYVGISSNRRMWEVSEKQSQERQSVYTEYLKITMDSNVTSDENICFKRLSDFLDVSAISKISSAHVTTKKKDKTKISDLLMPCVASSFGNSIVFTFEFADNYSAGEKSVEGTTGGAYAVFGQYVPYGDYYGKFYYMDIEFVSYVVSGNWNGNILPEIPQNTSLYGKAAVINDLKYRKDNREIPQISYELAAYSDNESLIVGSSLMSNSSFVKNNSNIVLYGLTNKLNKLSQSIDISELTDLNKIIIIGGLNKAYDTNKGTLSLTLPITSTTTNINTYKSFAVVTYPSTESISVLDDDGNVTTQTIQKGGELVLGINKTYAELGDNPKIYFAIKKSI